MAIDVNSLMNDAVGRLDAVANPDADRQEIKHLAQQFEAMLLTQMMREMRKSMVDEEDEGGLGAGPLNDNANIEFGSALSRNGGLGFADQMLAVFERQIATLSGTPGVDLAGGASVTSASAVRALVPLHPDAVAMPLGAPRGIDIDPLDVTSAAPVSSGFGWRRDPISGQGKFHAGVDIAVAYGQDVKSAAEGTVTYAGSQPGYGQTVVVDHGGGRQTRYAHLAEPLVRAGERVTEGQVVGKSGNSGRSTGPHLHFEMLVNGQAVDPLKGHT